MAKIDIVIPVKNDPNYKGFLPICLDSIYENVEHEIDQIFILSSESPTNLPKWTQSKIQFINENDFLKSIDPKLNTQSSAFVALRSGWIRQQLIKLYSFKLGRASYTLIVDADLCFLKPTSFVENGKFIFYLENEFYQPYFATIKKMLGYDKCVEESFIADHIFVDKVILEEMIREVELKHKKNFVELLNEILVSDPKLIVPALSEYEMYGTYVFTKHPHLVERSIRNPYTGLPAVYIPSPQNLNYLDIKSNLKDYNYHYIAMIADNVHKHDARAYEIQGLSYWK